MSDIEVEVRGEVSWIRLNRPERMNAYDAEMAEALIEAIENAVDSGVIVLTGTGRAFCAGGYLANLSDPDPALEEILFAFSRCDGYLLERHISGLLCNGRYAAQGNSSANQSRYSETE